MDRPLPDVLADIAYPGRGCVAWRSPTSWVMAYFLTGRSASSRARRLEVGPDGDIEVVNTGAGPVDPLRHYVAATRRRDWTVLGNGDHVVPLAEDLGRGHDPTSAWSRHTYEPDPPLHTPRIWVGLHACGDVLLGAVRRGEGGGDAAERRLWRPDLTGPGACVLVTTYAGTSEAVRAGGRLTSATSDAGSVEELVDEIWSALDPRLRVAALAVDGDGPLRGALLRHEATVREG